MNVTGSAIGALGLFLRNIIFLHWLAYSSQLALWTSPGLFLTQLFACQVIPLSDLKIFFLVRVIGFTIRLGLSYRLMHLREIDFSRAVGDYSIFYGNYISRTSSEGLNIGIAPDILCYTIRTAFWLKLMFSWWKIGRKGIKPTTISESNLLR